MSYAVIYTDGRDRKAVGPLESAAQAVQEEVANAVARDAEVVPMVTWKEFRAALRAKRDAEVDVARLQDADPDYL